jgi:chlorite dismutase
MSAPETLEGWFALHDLRTIDRRLWDYLSRQEREKAVAEATDVITGMEGAFDAGAGRSATYSVVGHKADLLMLHLRPEIAHVHELERRFDQTLLGSCMSRVYSYLSVIEVSRHAAPEGTAGNVEDSPYIQARIYPERPEHDAFVCFYPMSKKRVGDDNWYLLDGSERAELMRDHGRTGRKYAGKVTQIVTGSMGLDDWEWGVTLFADDPLQFKKLVYEMRFDEVSARYAEFGPFFVGRRLLPVDLGRWLGE